MDKPAKSDALSNQKRNSIYEDAEEGTPELHSIFTLLETFKDTKLALHLFMNNKFEEAEEKLISKSDKSIYHALGFGVILFIKSMMTCERKDLETAAEACKKSVSIIEKYRAKNVFLNPMSWLSNSNKNLTDDQIHAELCYAETLLLKAVLAFFTDETFSSFIKGALKVNTCHSIYRECYKIINTTQWEERDAVVREQFEAGTRMGIGIFNMMISIMPAKILKLLEFCGFYGNKEFGMNELTQASKMTETIRQPMACIYLLGWELIGSFVLGSGQCDFAFCERLLDPLLSDYPDGAIILFLKGRYYLIRGDVDNAIHFYNKSIKVQDSYKQFHHICYWELLFAFSFLQQWDRAAHNTKKLLDESKWSKCVYTYLMAILINADKKVDKRKETVALLANKVGKLRLRIAGKSIPVEKFCEKKAARYLKTGSFMLSHYEFFYFWHAFNILNSNQRQIRLILNDIEATSKQVVEEKEVDVNDQCLYYFLTGVCYRVLGQIEDANSAFNFVISNESVLTDSFYLVPNATYELALLRRDSGNSEQCDVLLKKALIYRGYSLETRLHLKIHNIASYL